MSNSFVNPWTVAHQAPLSMGFLKQEYWSELPFPSSGDLPDPAIEPMSLMSAELAGGFFTTEPPRKPWDFLYECQKYPAVVGLELPKCLPKTPQTIQIKNYFDSSGLQPPKKVGNPLSWSPACPALVLMWLHWTRDNIAFPTVCISIL